MGHIADMLTRDYHVAPEAARALEQDIAAGTSGALHESGGVSQQAMYAAIQNAARPGGAPLPQQYNDQLNYYTNSSMDAHQQRADQALANARGAMMDTTNIALNRGRTPSQALAQTPSNYQPKPQPDPNAGAGSIQRVPDGQLGTGQPPVPDVGQKYNAYYQRITQQDPVNGKATYYKMLAQRQQLLQQELSVVTGHLDALSTQGEANFLSKRGVTEGAGDGIGAQQPQQSGVQARRGY